MLGPHPATGQGAKQSGQQHGQQSGQHSGAPQSKAPLFVKIRDLIPAPGNVVNTQFIILEKYAVQKMPESAQTVCTALVADSTASVHLLLWGAETEHLLPGHIITLTNGIFSFHKSSLVLRAGKKGRLEKVGEFTMNFVEEPNLSRLQWVQHPSNPKQWVPAGGVVPPPKALASLHQQPNK